MASVRQIAEHAGVSIATVSRVLNNDPAVNPDTRDRVLSAANRWGYVPNGGRRIGTYIGFAYTSRSSLTGAFDCAVLDGVVRGADECRLDVVIVNVQRDKRADETYTQFFMRKGVRAVILRTVSESRDTCQKIAAEGFPHVVVSDRFDDPRVNYIDGDSTADSRRAVEYLVSLGHRRIAFAMHSVPDRDHLDRFEAYRAGLAAGGLAFDERLVFRHPSNLSAGGTILTLSQSLPDPPTAICCADPLLAVGAVQKAHELGIRIPDDVSIVGFDDADVRHAVYPTLTAVCQDAGQLGFQATVWLSSLLRGAATRSFRITIPTFFEINRSTAPPRENGRGLLPARDFTSAPGVNGFSPGGRP